MLRLAINYFVGSWRVGGSTVCVHNTMRSSQVVGIEEQHQILACGSGGEKEVVQLLHDNNIQATVGEPAIL